MKKSGVCRDRYTPDPSSSERQDALGLSPSHSPSWPFSHRYVQGSSGSSWPAEERFDVNWAIGAEHWGQVLGTCGAA